MAKNIDGPLYYERMGRTGPVMAFVHPNPMDQSCWIFQMAQMSTWYRCIAIDVPGYGRSPKCRKGVTMNDVAQGCWEAIDEIAPGEKAILVGCSVGSAIINYMHNLKPERTPALIFSGTGYQPGKEFAHRPHRRLQEIRHRLPLALHLRRSEPGVPRHAAGDVLRRHVLRAQQIRRHRLDHPSVRGACGAEPGGSRGEDRLPVDHPDRQRGRHPPRTPSRFRSGSRTAN